MNAGERVRFSRSAPLKDFIPTSRGGYARRRFFVGQSKCCLRGSNEEKDRECAAWQRLDDSQFDNDSP